MQKNEYKNLLTALFVDDMIRTWKTKTKGGYKVKLSKADKEARAAYLREWRAKNKDKVAAQNARYWKKKAKKIKEETT